MAFRARLIPGVLAAMVAASFACLRAHAAEEAVDMELVLAADVSRSIDATEAKLQRTGTADAFRNREIINAIRAGALGKIAVAYVDFSSHDFNTLVIDWRIIGDEKSALAFAGALLAAPPTYGQRTSISDALEYASSLFALNTVNGARKVIDVSGDGPNNYGRRVDLVRDAVVAKGIIINALPIVNEEDAFTYQYLPDLDRYFAGCVIGGAGAFVMKASSFVDFARAIRNKLFREIAALPAPREQAETPLLIRVASPAPPRAPNNRSGYARGCDIGERMRGNFGGYGPFNFDR